ncbi:hypothetical protein GUJ93_ZPchr0014g46660 [Zizania palustris]|uniref:HMA domain-containing protein n=1 Tax=Zizania palustris TaxID=103762 RepID=A0A8J5SWV0_ZIZPA|nr:hypothetical protein GUJ93_ZPchr0014g46660 [Zizania palustris]KAG8082571.1 hypothetical protein GUJ93_ZPchr0014g46660 [Zizania palustris]
MEEENSSSTSSVKLELKVYMHCDACERSVRRTVKNIDGVEKVELDREENKVTVTGDFEPEKVLKKIKKKTGKKAEILVPEEDDEVEEECTAVGHFAHAPYYDLVPLDEGGGEDVDHQLQSPARWQWDIHSFDDENTQGCRVM